MQRLVVSFGRLKAKIGRDYLVLGGNILLGVSAQALSALVGVIALPVLARTLDVEDFAYFGFLALLISVMAILDGLQTPFVQLCHEYRELGREAAFGKVARRINVLGSGCVGLMVGLFTLVVAPPAATPLDALFLALASAALFAGSYSAARLSSHQRIGVVRLIRGVSVAVCYVSFLGLSFLEGGPQYFALAVLCANLLVLIAYSFLATRYTEGSLRDELSRSEARDVVRKCIDGMIYSVVSAVYNFADRVLVLVLLSSAAYAAYTIAYEVGARLNFIAMVVSYPLYTLLSQYRQSSSESGGVLHRKVSVCLLLLMLFASVTVVYWSEPLIELFSGGQYREALLPFKIIVGATVFTSVTVTSVTWLRAHGDFRTQWKATSIGVLASLTVALMFLRDWGPNAAAVAYLIAQAVSSMILYMAAAASENQASHPSGLPLKVFIPASGVLLYWAANPLSGGIMEYTVVAVGLIGAAALYIVKADRRNRRLAVE